MDDKFNGDVDIIFEYSSFPPAKITAFSHFCGSHFSSCVRRSFSSPSEQISNFHRAEARKNHNDENKNK